jgi:hypothetical protein
MPREEQGMNANLKRAVVLAGLAASAAAFLPVPELAAEDVVRAAGFSSSDIPPQLVQDFGTVLQGQAVVLEIAVSNQRQTALTLGAVQPMCACMTEKSPRSIAAGGRGTVTLRLETADYSGPTTEAALIQWVDAPVPVTRIELKLDVKPVLQVLPKKLIRFRASQGAASEQVLDLETSDGKAFKITAVETSARFLSGAVTAAGAGAYRLTVTLSGDAPAGMLKESVTLHTDLPTLPTVKLNVTGLVTEAAKATTAAPASG